MLEQSSRQFSTPPEVLFGSHTTKWLLSRLTTDIEDDEVEDDFNTDPTGDESECRQSPAIAQESSFQKLSSKPLSETVQSHSLASEEDNLLTEVDFSRIQWIGFNGRSNKLADTCYVFWASASLAVRFVICISPFYQCLGADSGLRLEANALLIYRSSNPFTLRRHRLCASIY